MGYVRFCYQCTGRHAISYPEPSGSLDSGWSPGETCKPLWSSRSKNLNIFEFFSLSAGDRPLAKEPEDSEHEIGKHVTHLLLSKEQKGKKGTDTSEFNPYLQQWVGYFNFNPFTPVFIISGFLNELPHLVKFAFLEFDWRFSSFGKMYHRFFLCSVGNLADGQSVLHDAGRHDLVI